MNDACTLSKNCIVRLSLQASHVFHLSPFYLLSLHRATFALSFFFISTLLQFLCFPCRTFSVCRPLSSYTIFFHSAWLSHLLLSLAIYINISIFIYPLPSLHFFSLFLSVWFGDKCPLWMFDSAGSTAAAAVSSLAFHSGEKAGAAKMSNWLCKYSSACGVGIKLIFILFKKNKLYGKQEILAHSFRVFILITCFTLVDSTGESLNDFYLLSCWKWKHIFIFSWLSCRFQPFKGWSIKELRENKMLKKKVFIEHSDKCEKINPI